jgi:hypothetical protein
MHTQFWLESLGESVVLEQEGVCWFRLTQDEDQWRTLVDTVINLRIP